MPSRRAQGYAAALLAQRELYRLYPEYLDYFVGDLPWVWLTPKTREQLDSYVAQHVQHPYLQEGVRNAFYYSPTFRYLLSAILEKRSPEVLPGSPTGTGGLSRENGETALDAYGREPLADAGGAAIWSPSRARLFSMAWLSTSLESRGTFLWPKLRCASFAKRPSTASAAA